MNPTDQAKAELSEAPLSFTTTLKTREVTIDSKRFVLRELNGKQRDAYLNKNSKRLKFVNGKPVGLSNFDGVQADLLTECLYDEANMLVTAAQVAEWPAHVQSDLFDAARKLSKLGKDEVAAEEADADSKNG